MSYRAFFIFCILTVFMAGLLYSLADVFYGDMLYSVILDCPYSLRHFFIFLRFLWHLYVSMWFFTLRNSTIFFNKACKLTFNYSPF